MKIKYLSVAVALLLASSSAAQVPAAGYSAGYLINNSTFQYTDMLNLSQNYFTSGTARSTAMGGAYTSLGADISAMSINPAGLGMYRGSDVAFSPSLTISQMDNTRANGLGLNNIDGNRTTFGVANFGAAFNIYEGSKSGLTSFTLGFGYNKLANFNYQNTYMLDGAGLSIADLYMNQLRGVKSGAMKSGAHPSPWNNNSIDPSQWGAVLGYKTFLIDPVVDEANNMLYTINGIGPNADISHYFSDKISGSIGEYTISGGANFGNVFYVGLTIGMQDIYYKQEMLYEEYYDNNDVDNDHLKYMQFMPSTTILGTGYNAKVGVIVRPIPELRIGVAFHTPTYYDIEKNFEAGMYTMSQGNTDSYASTELLYYFPRFSSAPRLLTGVSYSIANIAIVAVDYERTWYNGMRLKGDASDRDKQYFKEDIKNNLQAANSFRAGLEVKPIPEIALRLGYGYYDGGLRTKKRAGEDYAPADAVFDAPVVGASNNYTLGIGFKFGDFYADAAYSLLQTKYTETDLFYYNGEVPDPAGSGQYIDAEYIFGSVTQKLSRHGVTLTFGYRF